MKKFVRIISTANEDEQIKMRSYLNDLGFYVLSLPNFLLEVNVIEDRKNTIGGIVCLITKLMKKLENIVGSVIKLQHRLLNQQSQSV